MSPVVIAGGGPAGAAAACLLARAGTAVTLLERDAGPRHKICGEFLSREALLYLTGLGVDAIGLGAAAIGALRLVQGRRVIETALPFQAAGWSRLAMDAALLHRAEVAGAEIRRGVVVRGAGPEGLDVDGAVMPAPILLLATGKHDLRGTPRLPARAPEALIGFKAHFKLAAAQRAALAGHVEVILFRDGYAGLQLIEGGVANLCLLVERARFDAAGQDWAALLADLGRESEHLARRMEGADMIQDRPLSIFRVPYGYVHAGAEALPGVFRLGDQAAVIPSFCGDGMSIALHSAHVAARTLLRGGDAAVYHATMRQDVGRPVRLAAGLYRLGKSRAARGAILAACGIWPGLMRVVAGQTRVPERAIKRDVC
jgi:flavin-dependent dehydrogenase